MTIHKEGFKIIFIAFILFIAVNAGIYFLFAGFPLIHKISVLVNGLLFLVIVNFFRSPKRVCISKENTVIAPADGKVVVIEEVDEPECLGTKCLQVSIFMSPLNVHVNWFPIGGLVKYVRHHKGRFMGAYLPKSSTENERTSVLIENKEGKKILVRQVAGAMARRIVCYANENTNVEQGEQMGFIKFGSRLDVYFPLDAEIKVSIGEKVKGNITVLGNI